MTNDLFEMERNFLPCLPLESLTKVSALLYPVFPSFKKKIVLCSKFLDQVFGVCEWVRSTESIDFFKQNIILYFIEFYTTQLYFNYIPTVF